MILKIFEARLPSPCTDIALAKSCARRRGDGGITTGDLRIAAQLKTAAEAAVNKTIDSGRDLFVFLDLDRLHGRQTHQGRAL
jgi:hypothetical protein